ncbi:4-hydroxy-tetrahydrodipicolinate synthase [Bacteroidia bacterium]|nr:4-hydroxy-tetrahydrodipicolinate synthase [Bacteroidia bacterium]
MLQDRIHGLGVALFTPFQANGSVDALALKRLVDSVIEGGANYLIVLGTTAETPTLTTEEQQLVIETVKATNAGRLPLIVGMGCNSTETQVARILNTDFDGIDGILSVAPYYNRPRQEGLYQHFKRIAEVSPKPIILYNIPTRCGVNIDAPTIVRLANECPNIIAVKEASGVLGQVADTMLGKPRDFLIIAGDDVTTLPFMTFGAVGVISVLANVFTKEMSQIIRLFQQGDTEKAQKIYLSLHKAVKLLFVDGNPSGIKYFGYRKGLCNDVFRLPIVPASDEVKQQIDDFLTQYTPLI